MVQLTTVSNGRGLHLLLGRDDVVRTFAVGFWYMSKYSNDNNSNNNDSNNNVFLSSPGQEKESPWRIEPKMTSFLFYYNINIIIKINFCPKSDGNVVYIIFNN